MTAVTRGKSAEGQEASGVASGELAQQKTPTVPEDNKSLSLLDTTSRDLVLVREDLRWSERRYRKIFESSLDGILVFDSEQQIILDLNQSFAKMMGYSRSELLSKPITDLWPMHLDRIAELAHNVISGVASSAVEIPCKTKIGRSALLELSSSFIDIDGIPCILCLVRDNTERNIAEERLRESEARYRTLANAGFEGIVITRKGEILDANKAVHKILGYEDNELIGRQIFDFVAPADRDLVLEHVKKGRDDVYQHRALRKNGEVVHVEVWPSTINHPGEESRMTAIRDVTRRVQIESEKKLLQEKLERSESMLDSIVKTIPDIIYRVDRDGVLTFVNDTVKSYGYSPRDLLGKNMLDLVHPDDREIVANRLTERRTGERRTKNLEIRFLAKDESIVPFEVRGSSKSHNVFSLEAEGLYERVEGDKDIYIGTQGVARDITSRKQAEELLRQKNSFQKMLQMVAVAANEATEVEHVLRIILEAVCLETNWPLGHVYLRDDKQFRLNPTNIWYLRHPRRFKTFREITEKTSFTAGLGLPGRVLSTGKPAWIFDVTKDDNFPRAKLANKIGVKAAMAFPVLIGTEVAAVLEFFSSEAIDPDESLLDIMAHVGTQLGRVFERKRAEMAHAESENRFRGFFEHVPEYCYMLSPEGKILDVNRTALSALKYSKEDLIGQPIDILYAPECRSKATDLVKLWEDSEDLRNEELNIVTSEGEQRQILLSTSAMNDESGQLLHTIIIQKDVTDLNLAQSQMVRSAKLSALGQLAAGIAHEVNNPLSIISLATGSALLDSEGMNPKTRDALETSQAAAIRAGEIVKNILAFAREKSIDRKIQNMHHLIDKVVDLSSTDARQAEVIVQREYMIDAPNIEIDDTQIQQVCMNLIMNAIHAMEDGGALIIRTSTVAKDKMFLIEFIDEGHGIPDDKISRVFDPFFTMKPEGVGTGLGLSISLGLIDAHGGDINVSSNPGNGTTFTVSLPIA